MDTLHQNPSAVVSFRRRDGAVAQIAGAVFHEVRQLAQTLFEDGALRLNRVGKPENVLFYWPLVEQDSALGKRFATVWQEPIGEDIAEAFFLGLRAYLVGEDRVGYVHTPTVRHPLLGNALFIETLIMNTVQVSGSELLRVLTKLAFFSRSHCYVDSGDCAWLADLLEHGIHTHILNSRHGWGEVISMLYGSVAVGSSVVVDVEGSEKGRFPDDCLELVVQYESDSYHGNARGHQVGLLPTQEEITKREQSVRSRWGEIPFEQRWDLADKAQRMPVPALNVFQISPRLTATQSFGDGLSGYDLYAFLLGDAQERS